MTRPRSAGGSFDPSAPPRAVLTGQPVCRTEDGREFARRLNALYYPAEIAPVPGPRGHGRPAPSVLNAVSSPDFTIGYIRPGSDVSVAPLLESTTYHVNLVLSGWLRSTSGSTELDVGLHRAAVYTAGQRHLVQRWSAGSEAVGFKFGRHLVESELEAMIGRPLDRPLVFSPRLDVASGSGRSWARLALSLLAELDRPGLASLPAVRHHLVQSAVAALLGTAQHNYSGALSAPGRPAPPAAVARAVDHIRECYAQPLTAGDLAVVAGVSLRRLQEAFADHLGVSPVEHLRDVRLERVRALLSSDPVTSVTEAAYACGFTHLGRFAAAYRSRYGEAPSATRVTGVGGVAPRR